MKKVNFSFTMMFLLLLLTPLLLLRVGKNLWVMNKRLHPLVISILPDISDFPPFLILWAVYWFTMAECWKWRPAKDLSLRNIIIMKSVPPIVSATATFPVNLCVFKYLILGNRKFLTSASYWHKCCLYSWKSPHVIPTTLKFASFMTISSQSLGVQPFLSFFLSFLFFFIFSIFAKWASHGRKLWPFVGK